MTEKESIAVLGKDTMRDGGKLVVDLERIGKATATVVKKIGDKTWYVFDGTIENSTMDDMDDFLSDLATKFPEPLKAHLEEIRLLDASEVFSDCDRPDQWECLQQCGIKMENPQIPYFKSVDHRQNAYELNDAFYNWWLRSMGTQHGFAAVDIDGDDAYGDGSISIGVRPLFVLRDIEK